jgi:hypothetical protein
LYDVHSDRCGETGGNRGILANIDGVQKVELSCSNFVGIVQAAASKNFQLTFDARCLAHLADFGVRSHVINWCFLLRVGCCFDFDRAGFLAAAGFKNYVMS